MLPRPKCLLPLCDRTAYRRIKLSILIDQGRVSRQLSVILSEHVKWEWDKVMVDSHYTALSAT